MKQVWERWSKQATKQLQPNKNEQIWQSRTPCLDIDYLVYLLRKGGSKREFVEKWKPYHPITNNLNEVKQITFNAPYVTEGFSKETFDQHETIIMKSCTGTGKTTAVAKNMEQEVPYSKLLSITTRMTLADQHQKPFEAIRVENYQDVKVSLYDADVLGICLNSFVKSRPWAKEKSRVT